MPGSPAKYLAVFNIGDTAGENIRVNWPDLGLSGELRWCAICGRRRISAPSAKGRPSRWRRMPAAFYKLTPAK